MQARYCGQVKCIYIDPPYNTGSDGFIYKDGYQRSSWATLIYNRLTFAKSLLSQTGIIFQSIDDSEQTTLKLISDDIFGKTNFVANFLWKKKSTTSNVIGSEVSSQTDYQFCYKKSQQAKIKQRVKEKETRSYPKTDELGNYRTAVIEKKDSGGYKRDTMKFPIMGYLPRDGKRWQIGQKVAKELEQKNRFIFDGEKILLKIYDFEDSNTFSAQPNIIDNQGNSEKASSLLNNDLFGISELFNNPKPIELISFFITITGEQSDLILDYFAGSGTTAHAVISLNREDGGRRKYILVEQGEYFDTVLKPRVQKVVYAENWKDGKPQADKESSLNGVPQIVKVLKLESYEDTLNNLVLKDNGDLFAKLNDGAKEDYLLRYMLADQSRDSLLNTDVFRRPFNYQMDIATNSAGATERMDIDLVETFNYLLGLRVHAVKDRIEKDGYLAVEGTLPDGEIALVFWRDCEKVGYEGLDALLGRLKINPQDSEYDTVYINGDHNIVTVWENENGVTGRLKIRQIESEFMALMFGEAQ